MSISAWIMFIVGAGIIWGVWWFLSLLPFVNPTKRFNRDISISSSNDAREYF